MFWEFQLVGLGAFVQLLKEVRTSRQAWILTRTFKTNKQKHSGCFQERASFVKREKKETWKTIWFHFPSSGSIWEGEGSAEAPHWQQQHRLAPLSLAGPFQVAVPLTGARRLAGHTSGGGRAVTDQTSRELCSGFSIRERQPSAGRDQGFPKPQHSQPMGATSAHPQEQPTPLYWDEILETDARDKRNQENACGQSREM